MFSSITMASSTTNPTESVSAISDKLFKLYPNRYITANVPMIDKGTTAPGIMVAETLRKNKKITMITRQMVSNRVKRTSLMDWRMESERSNATNRFTVGGISLRKTGSSFRMLSTTSTVLVPG